MDIKKMTLREKIGQTMMLDNLDRHIIKFGSIENLFIRYPIGCLYAGGAIVGEKLHGKDQVETIADKALKAAKYPLIIAADMEAGKVESGSSPLPPLMSLGAANDETLAYEYGKTIGYGALKAGIHWVFAPVADLNVNPDNPIVNIRSLGDNPKRVTKLLTQIVRGIESCGIAACAKHFPGLGSENIDSHITSVELPISKDEWNKSVRLVYQGLINENISTIMTAHAALPAYQNPNPDGSYTIATLSKEVTQDLLKGELGFNGVVVTDALIMGGFSGNSAEMEVRSFLAGSDVLLWPSLKYMDLMETYIQSGFISEERLNNSVNRIITLKEKLGLLNTKVNCEVSYDINLGKKIAEKSITLLNNKRNLLPLNSEKIKKILLVNITAREKNIPKMLRLKELLEQRNIEVIAKTDAWLPVLEEHDDCDINIFAIDRSPGGYHGSIDIFGENGASVWTSQVSNKDKTIIVSFGTPYMYSKYYKHIEHYINAYSLSEETLKAFCRAIFGEVSFTSFSPVKL